MNKVIQVNLAGLPFTFDDDAYEKLDDYLDALNGYFRGSVGGSDIMHDIEARLSELFSQNLKGRSIVTLSDVSAAISTLGTPEQLSGFSESEPEEEPEVEERAFNYSRKSGYSRYGKKLMRDPENKRIAGICSGLSAYFGIEDPLWIRIAFVISIFASGGITIPLYIALWIALPEAIFAKDRLAMRGEPIDIDNISAQVEREARQIANRIQEWGDEVNRTDWSSKFNKRSSRSKRPPRNSREQRKATDENYTA